MNFYNFTANKVNGKEIKMDEYKRKVLLIVNTASKCGLTPQLEGLENLYKEYKDKNFEILGFPCNQFANQDPGTNKEISEFCLINYGVTFTMFEKIDVNGQNAHPIYKFLKENAKGTFGSEIKWNFTKFLIDKEGNVIKRYSPITTPEKIKSDIEKLL
ncbi:glutathione peroxidase [Clostridium saccharoperbutylacetonicum]|uniref:glutathione peroxidase n=1 Tax=Clostridium saccharoperbutylacetonicum TaxID=36745 RepID=UPI0009838C5C|nr:glutathione peroxidase [Clostridium saccharoperbutylacetonicum]AQR93753.1 hydroperoxy fatty acid reductase gpx1 [Clostridium saccharoperbutylacetonicum]NSB29453.1 glutathione peroxidase [Clostridium saccharoperbutylacetonicum]